MRTAAALAAVSWLLGVSPALAQPGNTPPGPPPPDPYAAPAPAPYWQPPPARQTKRYGKTIATVDALSVAAIFGGALILAANINEGDTPDNDGGVVVGVGLMIGGGIGLFAGSPYVHHREGNSSGAWKALGLRLGVPLVASLLVEASKGDCDPSFEVCESDLDALPGLLFLGGMVIDWFVLAKVEVEAPVTPYLAPSPYGGATVGLGGSF